MAAGRNRLMEEYEPTYYHVGLATSSPRPCTVDDMESLGCFLNAFPPHRFESHHLGSLLQNAKQVGSFPDLSGLRGGDDGIRTHDPHVANVMLSQLSYIPTYMCAFAQAHIVLIGASFVKWSEGASEIMHAIAVCRLRHPRCRLCPRRPASVRPKPPPAQPTVPCLVRKASQPSRAGSSDRPSSGCSARLRPAGEEARRPR